MLTPKLTLPLSSKAAQKRLYINQIDFLNDELSMLTLLEHPREITSICKKITLIKTLIATLEKFGIARKVPDSIHR
jgi:hypothetical protein